MPREPVSARKSYTPQSSLQQQKSAAGVSSSHVKRILRAFFALFLAVALIAGCSDATTGYGRNVSQVGTATSASTAATAPSGSIASSENGLSATSDAGSTELPKGADASATPHAERGVSSQPSYSAAEQALENLAVKGRAPKTGYSRDQFGQRWADVDHNGCDTRNDILNRDLTNKTFKPGTHDCVVLTGTLSDPYTGNTIAFQRGIKTSEAVQIDHVVALSDAWQKGAQQLSAEVREQFANDPLNLLAVDGPTNAKKSDGDAATWLPPNKAFRCDYVARQIFVKEKYALWVTAAEKNAMESVLSSCTD